MRQLWKSACLDKVSCDVGLYRRTIRLVRADHWVGAFMLYMLFIIGQLAWESKAGKFGTFVIFLGLAFGMLGFVAKGIIQWTIGG